MFLVLATTMLMFILAACGSEPGNSGDAYADVGPEHVHGLGVNPADGALYIATHTGLFRTPRDSEQSERVGDRLQDTMGFAVVGPDRFIGSGHPDLRDDLPPLLGLISSSDGGNSWDPVSLLGQADFHALRAVGSRVVGYDASGDRLMISEDSGRKWAESPAPAPITDLVVDPADPDRIIAASEAGLIVTLDVGESWTRLLGSAGILAWPVSDALYGFAAGGAVTISRDGGESWEPAGELGGEPAAATALDRDTLIAALHDGRIVSSADGGVSWSQGAWSGG